MGSSVRGYGEWETVSEQWAFPPSREMLHLGALVSRVVTPPQSQRIVGEANICTDLPALSGLYLIECLHVPHYHFPHGKH